MDRAAREATGVARDTAVGPPHAAAAAHWVGDAVPQEVGRLRAAMGAFVGAHGAPDPLVQDVRLAVSEAVTNAVIHAYPDDAHGRLAAHASSEPATGVVTLRVRDYGIGCRPRADSPGLGAGIAVMTALARTIEITSPADGGTEVRLTFAVPRGAGTAAAAMSVKPSRDSPGPQTEGRQSATPDARSRPGALRVVTPATAACDPNL